MFAVVGHTYRSDRKYGGLENRCPFTASGFGSNCTEDVLVADRDNSVGTLDPKSGAVDKTDGPWRSVVAGG